jgi:predicted ArsR family transcriptional regulator
MTRPARSVVQKRQWRLTAKGHGRFPDTHGDLTVSVIAGIRSVFGQAGLDRLIEARQKAMITTYRQALQPYAGLGDRVGVLAQLRTAEGYMAVSKEQSDGSLLLIESRCPICAAAKACQGFCRSELELFQATFGADISVIRQEHLSPAADVAFTAFPVGPRAFHKVSRKPQSPHSRRPRELTHLLPE